MARAAARATARIFVVTDRQHVERKVSAWCRGALVVGKRQDLWSVIRLAIHKVAGIRCQSPPHRRGNGGSGHPSADAQATWGARCHVEGLGAHAL